MRLVTFVLLAAVFTKAPAASHPAARGLNLPQQHADTNQVRPLRDSSVVSGLGRRTRVQNTKRVLSQGNFLPGVFNYSSYNMTHLERANFDAVRLGINVETARDEATLKTLRGYVSAFGDGSSSIICMWDTLLPGQVCMHACEGQTRGHTALRERGFTRMVSYVHACGDKQGGRGRGGCWSVCKNSRACLYTCMHAKDGSRRRPCQQCDGDGRGVEAGCCSVQRHAGEVRGLQRTFRVQNCNRVR